MPTSSSSSLTRHLDDLYPLARVLGGEERADALVTETYRRAAETPPDERPEPVREWLVRLLLEVRRSDTDDTANRGPGDPFGQEAARQAAERTLPVAFAACSAQERAILTLDVLSSATVSELAAALDTEPDNARTLRDEARSALRAALRDSLTGPERMLVDVALSESELREALREVLTHQFHPTPPDLRATVTSVLEKADDAASRPSAPPEDASSDETSEFLQRRTQVQERSRRRRSRPLNPGTFDLRRAVVGVFLVLAIGLGGYVASVLLSPSSSSPATPPTLTQFVAEQSGSLAPTLAPGDSNAIRDALLDAYDRRLAIPRIRGTRLSGLGVVEPDGGPSIPVLLFADTTRAGEQLAAFAFTYASLDSLSDRARLPTGIRASLEAESTVVTRRSGTTAVLFWRHRDDVFALTAPGTNPNALAPRIEKRL